MSLGNGTQDGFDKAAESYFHAVTLAGVTDEQSGRIAETYGAYLEVLQEAWASTELQDRAQRAFEEYAAAVRQTWAPAELAALAAEAYRDYLRALCTTWSDVDAEAMNPATLAAIAHGMQTIAWAAGLSLADTGLTENHEGALT